MDNIIFEKYFSLGNSLFKGKEHPFFSILSWAWTHKWATADHWDHQNDDKYLSFFGLGAFHP